jgi:hypothetical protein
MGTLAESGVVFRMGVEEDTAGQAKHQDTIVDKSSGQHACLVSPPAVPFHKHTQLTQPVQ